MKIAYVGCNPSGRDSLLNGTQINELERVVGRSRGEVTFTSRMNLRIDDLPRLLTEHKPDLLHLAVHGNELGNLDFVDAFGMQRPLDAQRLASYLKTGHAPTLVYLNGCNSVTVANKLVEDLEAVCCAIGIEREITNRAAIESAIDFYEHILAGNTIQRAFEFADETIALLEQGITAPKSALFSMPEFSPAKRCLHRVPELIAKFNNSYRCDPKGYYKIRFGMSGCLSDTRQVVFISDETANLDPSERTDVSDGVLEEGIFWDVHEDDPELIDRDYNMYACGITSTRKIFTVASTVCEALKAYFRVSKRFAGRIPRDAQIAIRRLESKRRGLD